MRYATARRLLYLLQGTSHRFSFLFFLRYHKYIFIYLYTQRKTTGTFAETTSPEHQMHWIIENCKTVRAADGLTVIVDALKLLSVKHEKIS